MPKYDMNEYVRLGPVYRALAGLISALGLLGIAGAYFFSAPGEISLANEELKSLVVPMILMVLLTSVCLVVAIRGYPPKFLLFMLRPKD